MPRAQTLYRVTWTRPTNPKPNSRTFGRLSAAQKQIRKVQLGYEITPAQASKAHFLKAGYVEPADTVRLEIATVVWQTLGTVEPVDMPAPTKRQLDRATVARARATRRNASPQRSLDTEVRALIEAEPIGKRWAFADFETFSGGRINARLLLEAGDLVHRVPNGDTYDVERV